MKYARQRGTHDILPSETHLWHFVESKAKNVFDLYHYSELRTPIFEATELFTRSIGEGTDIIGKEMYTFIDKGDRSITLRPEETAPVVRAAIENNLFGQGELLKLYYLGPMFRYERPQAGRQRQFHQAGIEVFGSSEPLIDVEVIEIGVKLLTDIGIKDIEVDINSVGCKKCRPGYKEALKTYLTANSSKLCDTCKTRVDTNTMRVLDCKDPGCAQVISKAPWSGDHLCEECSTHFRKVRSALDIHKIKYKINKKLVRGLDYYTKTTFEIVSGLLGAQNAVCGGGRYDGLVEELGGKPTPAVGFAIGLERLIMMVQEQKIIIPMAKRVQVYVAPLGELSRDKGYEILKNLRQLGIKSEMDYQGRSLNSQLKNADRINAKFVVIIGEDELKNDSAIIRSMENKTQEVLKFAEVIKKLTL